ncbi:G-protein coupled receptor Mth2 [Eumeta japonica]|uniref:G-protein coupled receptor Mth2 n=1 Tax=Eumeta variegata TaxID=151549 RepID=A0A4C1W4T2_EUMVA|nr:G-protein coupled receptor Mth2 [Eumeta japonica]
MMKVCSSYDGVLNYSSIPIYKDGLKLTTKRIDADIDAVKVWELNKEMALNLKFMPQLNRYLIENGMLYVESPNDYKRWFVFNNTQYCFDFVMKTKKNETSLMLNFWVVFSDIPPIIQDLRLTSSAMLVSSFFLVLVLIVYALLPPLRNLPGLILMAYAVSELGAFLCLGILQLLQLLQLNSAEVCMSMSPTIYFFFLAAFCWMNVMSFDLWWTFRGYAKARPIHRRGEKFKFGVYCAYAYGVPGAMTAMLVTLMHTDMTQWPWFITPAIPRKGCFLEKGELFLYLYVPMLILIISNWVLFVMTAFNVWRLRRDTAVLNANDNRAHRSHQQRFGVYLKLSVVMGISWILEVISALKPELNIWKVTDLYNLLTGLFIFVIFICKKKIFRMLKKRCLRYFKRYNRDKNQSFGKRSQCSASSSDASSTYDYSTDPATVSLNPKGSATWTKISVLDG